MSSSPVTGNEPGPVVAVGAIVHDGEGRLLVVLRGREPARGRWSLPGGRVRRGERAEEAVVREVAEETGLRVRVDRLVGHLDVVRGPSHYLILDFAADVLGGELAAADDADDARFVTRAELERLDTTDGLLAFLDRHGCAPTA